MTTTPQDCCSSGPEPTASTHSGAPADGCCPPPEQGTRSTSEDYKNEYSPTVADKWDQLIDWDHRDTAEAEFFTKMLHDHGATTVLDAACGTGYHAWALTRSGFTVTASDGAPEMVRKTRENLAARGLKTDVHEADWRQLSDAVPGRYDAVLCLGNSFSHLFENSDRDRALAEFRSMLAPGGMLVLDHRNYDALLSRGFTEKRRNYCCGAQDVKIRPSLVREDVVHFRYDFPDGTSHEVTQSPLRQDAVTQLLRQTGFENLHRYGDMRTGDDCGDADFIIHTAQRPRPH